MQGQVQQPFVGRDAEFASLLQVVRSASLGFGTVVVLGGDIGMGKESLLRRVMSQARADDPRSEIQFLSARCRREQAPQDAYEPFGEILVRLLETEGGEGKRAVLKALREEAPNWLGVVP